MTALTTLTAILTTLSGLLQSDAWNAGDAAKAVEVYADPMWISMLPSQTRRELGRE